MMLRSVRTAFIAIAATSVVMAACGDGGLSPAAVAGYYTLVSVNGQSLPYVAPPSIGLGVSIWRGDLLLRGDGTFMLGIGGVPGLASSVAGGTYQQADGELVFRAQGASQGDESTANISGDSIVFDLSPFASQSLHLAFRRAPRNPSAMSARSYGLTSVDGRTGDPVVFYDTTINGTRYVGTASDTLIFDNEVFFRRHRIERVQGSGPGDVLTFSEEVWTRWGAFERGDGWVRLMYYHAPTRDSLSIAGDTLIRRTLLITGIREERYTSR